MKECGVDKVEEKDGVEEKDSVVEWWRRVEGALIRPKYTVRCLMRRTGPVL